MKIIKQAIGTMTSMIAVSGSTSTPISKVVVPVESQVTALSNTFLPKFSMPKV